MAKQNKDYEHSPAEVRILRAIAWTGNVYATREAAQVEVDFWASRGQRGYRVIVENLHNEDLARRRWTS